MCKTDLSKIQKILIIKMSSIGDVIHALPTLTVLRRNFPKAYIAWVVEPKSYDIVRAHPLLDKVILLDLKSLGKKLKKPSTFREGIKEIKKLAKELENTQYDLVLDLQGLFKSGIISFFTKAPIRLVYCNPREGSALFATHVVPKNPNSLHAVQKSLDVARFLDLEVKEGDDQNFLMAVLPEDEQYVDQFLAGHNISKKDKIIGLNPGAAWITKQWPPEHYADLGDMLIERGYQVILFGGPVDIELIEKVARQMKKPPIKAAGKTTLKQLAALIKRCEVFVGNDTGPMHLSIAVNTPVVAIFGPTNHIYTGPYGHLQIVVRQDLECAPCFQAKKCPQYKEVKCLTTIKPEEVLEEIEKFL